MTQVPSPGTLQSSWSSRMAQCLAGNLCTASYMWPHRVPGNVDCTQQWFASVSDAMSFAQAASHKCYCIQANLLSHWRYHTQAAVITDETDVLLASCCMKSV